MSWIEGTEGNRLVLLNNLASVLRSAGLAVTEHAGWQGHNHGAMSSVECIVIHHTAGAATGDYPSRNVVRNGRAGLPGPLAQLGCGRSGRMYVFSNGVSWHAGAVRSSWMDNYHAIGIEVESVGTGPVWPNAQVHAAAKATAALCRAYGVPVARVLGHKEVCSPPGRKVDPVGIPGDMPAFRALVQRYLNGDVEDDDMATPAENWGYKGKNDTTDMRQKLVDALVAADLSARTSGVNQQHIYKIESMVSGFGAALAAATSDQNITEARLADIVNNAVAEHTPTVEQTVAALIPHLAHVVRDVMGDDNADQADAIVDALVARLNNEGNPS